MKITTLIENKQDDKKLLKNEHGLSMFIETKQGNYLFDTGSTGDFIENAQKLNIDLNSIDAIILSHAHFDHCGGVKKLLETYDIKPKFIVGKDFFKNSNKYYYSDGTSPLTKEIGYIPSGINFDEEYIKGKGLEIVYVDGEITLEKNITIHSNFNKYFEFEKENSNMTIKEGNEYILDHFSDEIAISIREKKGLIILLGCAHPGFLNIVNTIKYRITEKIFGIIGGTHLVEGNKDRLSKSIQCLKELKIKLLGLSHCTGIEAENIINDQFKNSFINKTGTIIKL